MNNAFFVSFTITRCQIFSVRPELSAESLLNGKMQCATITVAKRKAKAGIAE